MNEVQAIHLDNRKELSLSGVIKLETLNKLEFLVVTNLGNLLIKGSDLEMKLFDIEKGNMHISGSIDSLSYFNKSSKKTNKGFIQKLFK